jgi:hypothetical protein
MNTTIVAQPEVKSMLSAAEVAQAIGEMDAAEGHPFCPEFFFIRVSDKLAYTKGFETIKGECEITRCFKASYSTEKVDGK